MICEKCNMRLSKALLIAIAKDMGATTHPDPTICIKDGKDHSFVDKKTLKRNTEGNNGYQMQIHGEGSLL